MKEKKRVGAINVVQAQTDGTRLVKFFGFGTHEGDICPFTVPEEHRPAGALMEIMKQLVEDKKIEPEGFVNPCITLDSGETVWGCECWWAPEEEIHRLFDSKDVRVEFVSINALRKEVQAAIARAYENMKEDLDGRTEEVQASGEERS